MVICTFTQIYLNETIVGKQRDAKIVNYCNTQNTV